MSKKKRSSFRGKVRSDSERQNKAASSYGYLILPKDVNVYNPPPGGTAKLDFIPYEVSDKHHMDRNEELEIGIPETLWYKRPFKTHREIGIDNESVVCLSSIGKKCPICEKRAELIKNGADKEDTDFLRPKLRNLYAVIPHDSKDHEQEIHIWDMSQWLFQNLLNDELEEDEDNEIFPDLEEGKIVKTRFSEEKYKKNTFASRTRH